jgi:Predicted membrane protein
MPDPVLPPRESGGESNRGILAELLNFLSSLGEHLQALLALAGLEGREAAGIYLRAVVALVAALILLLVGYLLAVIFVAFALAALFHWDWIWISLALAAAHFLGVAGCLWYFKSRVKSPVFTSTSAELKRDFAALKNFKS